MTLDVLYDRVKEFHYPINSRSEVMKMLKHTFVKFEGSMFDERNIALAIEKYPIQTPADSIKFFIEAFEEYNIKEGEELKEALMYV